jgi:hypothetical protein
MSIEIKLTFDTTAEAVAFLSKTLPAETPAPIRREQPKAEQPKAEPEGAAAISYDADIKPRVLKVAKRPVVGMAMIQQLFARAGVSNAQQIKPEYYPHFLKLLDLADAAEDEDSLQDAIAAIPDSELAV